MKSIHSFFHLALMTSFFIISSCNSASNNDDNKDDGNTIVANESGGSNSSNNVVSKKGLPLSPKQEVPPVNSPASGTADVSYNKDSHMLTFTINWTGLTDNPIMSHIHGPAAKGANAGVKHDFSNSLPKTTSGSFSDSVKIEDVGIKEDSLLGGFYYLNIHTPKNKPGE